MTAKDVIKVVCVFLQNRTQFFPNPLTNLKKCGMEEVSKRLCRSKIIPSAILCAFNASFTKFTPWWCMIKAQSGKQLPPHTT